MTRLLAGLATVALMFGFAAPAQARAFDDLYQLHANTGTDKPFGIYCGEQPTVRWVQINQTSYDKCNNFNSKYLQALGGTILKCRPLSQQGGYWFSYVPPQGKVPAPTGYGPLYCWVNNL